jgi:hypothetical protein
VEVEPGGSPHDFLLIDGAFNTGLRTQVDVSFSISGSGTARAGASLDDFFVSQATPEPSTLLLLTTGAMWLVWPGGVTPNVTDSVHAGLLWCYSEP